MEDRTYYDIYLRSDLKNKKYVLTYSSLSYFGDAGGILTLLLLLGKFVQGIIANEKVKAIMLSALY